MERLTYWSEEYNCWCYDGPSGEAANRLAAYEDTGLEPEEILTAKELAEVACAMNLLKEYQDIGPIDHLRELAQAEKDGRLVVLPHGRWTPFHSDIAGDIQYCSVCEIGFEEMTDFCPHCGAKMDLPEAALKKREEVGNEAD